MLDILPLSLTYLNVILIQRLSSKIRYDVLEKLFDESVSSCSVKLCLSFVALEVIILDLHIML